MFGQSFVFSNQNWTLDVSLVVPHHDVSFKLANDLKLIALVVDGGDVTTDHDGFSPQNELGVRCNQRRRRVHSVDDALNERLYRSH